jgi:hypothetical protein
MCSDFEPPSLTCQLGLGYYNISGGILSPQSLMPPINTSTVAIFAGTVHTCALASNNM